MNPLRCCFTAVTAVLLLAATACSAGPKAKATIGTVVPLQPGQVVTVTCANRIRVAASASGQQLVVQCPLSQSTTSIVPTTTVAPTTTTAPSPPTSVVPQSIAHDCSAPVDAQLTAWLGSLAPGTVARLGVTTSAGLSPGCYAIDGSITLNNANGLDLEGNGSTVKAITLNGRSRADFIVAGGSNVTFRNLTVLGFSTNPGPNGQGTYVNGVDYEWQHGISFSGTQGALVDNVTVEDVIGDFIEAQFLGNPTPDPTRPGYYLGTTPSRNIVVQNSHLDGSDRQGLGLTDVDGFTLRDSFLGDTGQAGIDLELDFNGEVGRNIDILNDTFGPIWFSAFSNTGAGGTGDVGNVTISGDVMTAPLTIGKESCQPPVLVQAAAGARWSGYTVTDNTWRAFGSAAIVTNVDDLALTGNTLAQYGHECGGASDAGISATGDTGTVSGNDFTGEPQVFSNGGGNGGLTVCGNRNGVATNLPIACA